MQTKQDLIDESREAQQALELDVKAAKEANSGQESSHESAKQKLKDLLLESKEALEGVEAENAELKQRCAQQETKINDNERYQ